MKFVSMTATTLQHCHTTRASADSYKKVWNCLATFQAWEDACLGTLPVQTVAGQLNGLEQYKWPLKITQ